MVMSYFADVLDPRLLLASTTRAAPPLRNTARNCIFIFLYGAPSQVDMWDFKEGPWTPADFAPESHGEIRWPHGLLPKTGEHLDKLAIVRSGQSWASVHQLGRSWVQLARNPAGPTGSIAPHIGAVVALESQEARGAADVLPAFVALNAEGVAGSGYLPARYAPFGVQTIATGLPSLVHPTAPSRFTRRLDLIQQLREARTSPSLGKAANDMTDSYAQGEVLMHASGINELFSFDAGEHDRYGATPFGDSLVVARNLVASRRGTRFVYTTLTGWDHHSDIYDHAAEKSLYAQSRLLDPAVGALLTDLASMNILDETLVVLVGEFGRTAGPPNNQGGRDHALRNSIVFAGGGVRGGRVIGQTDDIGQKIVDYGWSANRDVRTEDVACTIYSALGIDYTTIRQDDPLGRGFEYVPHAKDGGYGPVEELWG